MQVQILCSAPMNKWKNACREATNTELLIIRLCDLELEAMETGETEDWKRRWEELGKEIHAPLAQVGRARVF